MTIEEMIREQLPEAQIEADHTLGGITFLDIMVLNGRADIVYDPRQGVGIGVNTTCTPFCSPDEVYTSPKEAVDRVVSLLRSGGTTYREDLNGPRDEFQAALDKLAEEYGRK